MVYVEFFPIFIVTANMILHFYCFVLFFILFLKIHLTILHDQRATYLNYFEGVCKKCFFSNFIQSLSLVNQMFSISPFSSNPLKISFSISSILAFLISVKIFVHFFESIFPYDHLDSIFQGLWYSLVNF